MLDLVVDRRGSERSNVNDFKKLFFGFRINKEINTQKNIFQSYGFTEDDVTSKLGNVIGTNVIGLNLDSNGTPSISGNLHIRAGRYTKFKTVFKSITSMKSYCDFIDALSFLKENVGHTFKTRLNSSRNISFFIESNKELTVDNIDSHLREVIMNHHQELDQLKKENSNIENLISSKQTEIKSMQKSNDGYLDIIEQFSLCKNNLFNALRYYFVQKDDSAYNKILAYFKN